MYLPLRLRATHDGDLALLLRVGGRLALLVLLERRDLHRGAAEPDDVADVGTLGADDRTHRVVRDVQVGRLLHANNILRASRHTRGRKRKQYHGDRT